MLRRIGILVLMISLISSPLYGECKFSKHVKEDENGNYVYTAACHERVGAMYDLTIKQERLIEMYKGE